MNKEHWSFGFKFAGACVCTTLPLALIRYDIVLGAGHNLLSQVTLALVDSAMLVAGIWGDRKLSNSAKRVLNDRSLFDFYFGSNRDPG